MSKKSILKPPAKSEQNSKAAPHQVSKRVISNAANDTSSAKMSFPAKRTRKISGVYGTRGTIGLEQTITIVQKTLRQETPFAESCLPKTMKIAIESRELLFPLLSSYPSSWSFIDKVFVMLTPLFEADVTKFYANNGLCMAKIYSRVHIELFDERLSKHLSEKIEAIRVEKKVFVNKSRAKIQ